MDLHKHPKDQCDEQSDKRDGKHKVEKMDGGYHLSLEIALTAIAAPAAPMAMPSPEMVVVVVLVPSGAMLSVTVQDANARIVAAITNGRLCFSFMVFLLCFFCGALVEFLDALVLQFDFLEKVLHRFP